MASRTKAIGATWATALAVVLVMAPPECRAACIALPDASLLRIDQLAEALPEKGVAAADAALHAPGADQDPFRQAQLYAIIAQARSDEGRTAEAHAAVEQSRARADGNASPAVVRSLHARLVIADHINAESTSELATAISALTDELAVFATPSPQRGCLLAARSELYTEQLQLDSAAADAIAAYTYSTANPVPEVRAAASVALGALYRRSGLPIDAQRMYDESLDFFRKKNAESQVLTLSYFRAQALADQGREREALAAFEEVRAASQHIGDDMGVAIASLPICDLLLKLQRIDDAQRECVAGMAQFKRAGRSDLENLLTGYLAEIDGVLDRPRAALTKYAAILGDGGEGVLPVNLARWYRGRSRALAALGRLSEALDDLARADSLSQKHDLDQRARAASAVKAIADANQQAERERTLQERVIAQERELTNRATIHWLAGAVAALAAFVAAILACLLWLSRRHARIVRRQAAILRSATANAPDALILLDADLRILYANRSLLGDGPPPVAGTTITAALGEPSRTTVERVLQEVCSDHAPRTIAVTIPGAGSGDRSFEVWVLPVVERSRLDRLLLRSFDVTEVRRLEREVANRSSIERDRLSGDMHEGLCQELAGIAMLVSALEHAKEWNPRGAKARLGEIAVELSRAVALTSALARGVSPVRTARGMLGPALRQLGAEVCARTGSDIVTRCPSEDRELPPLIADQVYQIVSDGLSYATSCADRVEVDLAESPWDLNLQISFAVRPEATAPAPESERLLKLMAHRALLIGGSLSDTTTQQLQRQLILTVPVTDAVTMRHQELESVER